MPRPNVLLITSDQHHFDFLGVTRPGLRTPHLDRLAREGTRFDRAYTCSPVCSPSRATIVTGMYPSVHGCWNLGVKLAEDVPTVGERFQEAGYRTALLGKAHFQPLASAPGQESLETPARFRDLDFWRGFHGPWYGFEEVAVHRNHADEAWAGQHYGIWLEERGVTDWERYFRGGGSPPDILQPRHGAWDLPEEHHYGAFVAEKTIAAIERAGDEDRPFFAWASFADPHPPYLVPEPWASLYDPEAMEPGTRWPGELERMPPHHLLTQDANPDFSPWRETPWANHGFHSHRMDPQLQRRNVALYCGMISLMDSHIGRILDHLDARGLAQDTLVVFTTDHGHFLGQHGLWHKGAFPYEDLLRLPFLVRWPGRVGAGGVSHALQSLIDLPETFLDACGIPVPGVMQGVSQLPVWTGAATSAREEALCEFRHQPTALHLKTLITDRYKMTVYRDRPYGELFDLERDPQERRNLWDDPAAASEKAQMMTRLVHADLRREPTRFPRIAHA